MKKRMVATVLATVLVMTGCGSQVPDLSQLDNSKAAEYIAGEVLKYDKKYEDAFDYDRSVLNPTPMPTPTLTPMPAATEGTKASGGTSGQGGSATADGGSAEEATLQEVSLSELIAVSGVQISVSSCVLKDSYGKGYEFYQAQKGKKLLIVYFRLKNTTGKSKKVDLSGKKSIQYSLTMEDASVGQVQHTIASGDLQYFKQTIKAGKSRQGILIFEVDKNVRANGTVFHATDGTRQASVPLK